MILTLVPLLFGCTTLAARANETVPSNHGETNHGENQNNHGDTNHGETNHGEAKPSGAAAIDSSHSDSAEIRRLFSELNGRLQSLEEKISLLDDKLDSAKTSGKTLRAPSSEHSAKLSHRPSPQTAKPPELPQPTGVIQHPSSSFGSDVEVSTASRDPESGFVNDEAVKLFRKAMIFFQGQKYPESVLTFSDFLEKFPDHALAGSAQYYVGESYVRQKEYRLAIQEFQRVLTSYDRSPHVADTLNEMAYSEEALKKTSDAAKHRQLLSSLFPHAPAMAIQERIPAIEKIQGLDTPPIVATSTRAPLITEAAASPSGAGTALDQPPNVSRNTTAGGPVIDGPSSSTAPVMGTISAPTHAAGSSPSSGYGSSASTETVITPLTAPISEPISNTGAPGAGDFHNNEGEGASAGANETNEGAPLPNQ
jgi:TolA-binding protein